MAITVTFKLIEVKFMENHTCSNNNSAPELNRLDD